MFATMRDPVAYIKVEGVFAAERYVHDKRVHNARR